MLRKYIGWGALFAVGGIAVGLWDSQVTAPPAESAKIALASDLSLATAPLLLLDGTPKTLADFPRQLRLVNFWATWCAPCIHEMPLLEAAQKNHPQVKFVGISIDEAAVAKKFLREMSITYDIFTAKFDIFYLFSQNGNKNGVLPYTLLVDSEGKIVAQKLGEFHSTEDIEQFISANTS